MGRSGSAVLILGIHFSFHVISMLFEKTELSIRLVSREAISSYGGSRGCGSAVALRSTCQFSK